MNMNIIWIYVVTTSLPSFILPPPSLLSEDDIDQLLKGIEGQTQSTSPQSGDDKAPGAVHIPVQQVMRILVVQCTTVTVCIYSNTQYQSATKYRDTTITNLSCHFLSSVAVNHSLLFIHVHTCTYILHVQLEFNLAEALLTTKSTVRCTCKSTVHVKAPNSFL